MSFTDLDSTDSTCQGSDHSQNHLHSEARSSEATLVDIAKHPTSQPHVAPDEPACWRLSEVRNILHGNNQRDILRLRRFRPFNDKFLTIEGYLSLSQIARPAEPHEESISTEALEADEDKIVELLDKKSLAWFRKVPFEDWVQRALGLWPDSIIDLCFNHIRLGLKLRRHICRHPEERERFEIIAQMLWKKNHFAHTVVVRASARNSQWMSMPLRFLDFAFILNPLRNFLSEPTPLPRVLQELEVLAVRFQRLHRNPKADLSRVFSIDITFLRDICDKNVACLAISRTYHDLECFRKLRLTGIVKRDKHTRSLNMRWNSLCRAVEECAVIDELRPRLVEFAKTLYSLRNFFSSSAVLQGLRSSNIHLKSIGYLINVDNNYELYRRRIDPKPALHFLFPLTKAVYLDDERAVPIIFKFRDYQIRSDCNCSSCIYYPFCY